MSYMQAANRAARLLTVAVALALSSPIAYAQQPSPAAIATAKEIVAATSATTMFQPLIAGVVEQAKNLLLQQNPNLSKDLNEIANQLRKDLAPRFDELGNEVAKIYATHFTEQELKDMLVFYNSPLGKKVLSEQPAVVDASLKFAQVWANTLSDEVVAKLRDELKKRGHAL